MIGTDFLVVGSGIAGMSTALRLAELGEVVLISKKGLLSGSTPYAQGGIAGVRQAQPHNDSVQAHYEDTIRVGCGHNDPAAVELLVTKAAEALRFLETCGVSFDESLHLEGGHRFPRVWHVADHTGITIASALRNMVRASDAITVIEDAIVSDLLVRDQTVCGVEFYHDNESQRIFAARTVLATGGAGQIFAKTTNPVEVTGDGMALAVRAGAQKRDLEFVQFHPTAFENAASPLFLLTEALRGFGGRIVNADGIEICDSLAPRDEVARAITFAQRHGKVFLDFSMQPIEFWQERFPEIYQHLRTEGLLLGKDPIPVTPAAHFICGGITSDLRGRSTLEHLSVVGENACTGVHGANRLASNSLLEGVVFSAQIADDFATQINKNRVQRPDMHAHYQTRDFVADTTNDGEIRKKIKQICSDYLGIIRSMPNIDRALSELSALDPTGTQTKNLQAVAIFVAEAAAARTASLGCHYLIDAPVADPRP